MFIGMLRFMPTTPSTSIRLV